MKDKRYTNGLEWCGQERPMYILRFCGKWVNWFYTKPGAITYARILKG